MILALSPSQIFGNLWVDLSGRASNIFAMETRLNLQHQPVHPSKFLIDKVPKLFFEALEAAQAGKSIDTTKDAKTIQHSLHVVPLVLPHVLAAACF